MYSVKTKIKELIMKKLNNTLLIGLMAIAPLANAGKDYRVSEFLTIGLNEIFVPQFYDESKESDIEGVDYEVALSDDSVFDFARVTIGQKDFPYIVKGCSSKVQLDDIAEVIETKYSHYPQYQRTHHSPLANHRFSARINQHLFLVEKESHIDSETNETVYMSCVRAVNLDMPNYNWLSNQDENMKSLYKEL